MKNVTIERFNTPESMTQKTDFIKTGAWPCRYPPFSMTTMPNDQNWCPSGTLQFLWWFYRPPGLLLRTRLFNLLFGECIDNQPWGRLLAETFRPIRYPTARANQCGSPQASLYPDIDNKQNRTPLSAQPGTTGRKRNARSWAMPPSGSQWSLPGLWKPTLFLPGHVV